MKAGIDMVMDEFRKVAGGFSSVMAGGNMEGAGESETRIRKSDNRVSEISLLVTKDALSCSPFQCETCIR